MPQDIPGRHPTVDIFERFASAFPLVSNEDDRWETEGAFLAELARTAGSGKGRVLDLACGSGFHARHLAREGFTATAVDHSEAAIATGRGLAGGDALSWRAGDITQPGDGEYDLALLVGNTLSLFDNEESVLRVFDSAAGILAPKGALVIHVIDFDYLRNHAVRIERSGQLDGRRVTFIKCIDATANGAVIRITVKAEDGGSHSYRDATQNLHEWNVESLEVAATNCGFTLSAEYGGFDKRDHDAGTTKDIVLVFVKT
jgi:SAM-dependent methyltransferase